MSDYPAAFTAGGVANNALVNAASFERTVVIPLAVSLANRHLANWEYGRRKAVNVLTVGLFNFRQSMSVVSCVRGPNGLRPEPTSRQSSALTTQAVAVRRDDAAGVREVVQGLCERVAQLRGEAVKTAFCRLASGWKAMAAR